LTISAFLRNGITPGSRLLIYPYQNPRQFGLTFYNNSFNQIKRKRLLMESFEALVDTAWNQPFQGRDFSWLA
jgi:hypothetical protein